MKLQSVLDDPQWEADMAAYAAAQDAAIASGGKGWTHASCDHGSGYCAATPSNTYP